MYIKGSFSPGWWSQNWLNICRLSGSIELVKSKSLVNLGEFGWFCFKSIEVKSKSLVIVRELDPYIQVAKVDFQSSRTVRSLGEEWQFGYFFKRCSCTDKTILCAFWRQVSVFLGNITTWLGNVLNVSLLNWSIVFPMWIVPLDLYFWDGLQPPISLNQFEIPFWVVYIFTGSWFCSCGLTDHW